MASLKRFCGCYKSKSINDMARLKISSTSDNNITLCTKLDSKICSAFRVYDQRSTNIIDCTDKNRNNHTFHITENMMTILSHYVMPSDTIEPVNISITKMELEKVDDSECSDL